MKLTRVEHYRMDARVPAHPHRHPPSAPSPKHTHAHTAWIALPRSPEPHFTGPVQYWELCLVSAPQRVLIVIAPFKLPRFTAAENLLPSPYTYKV